MWKTARHCMLLLGTLLWASASDAATGQDVLLTMPITVDGSLKNLQLLRGESYEDAALSFVQKNGLLNAQDDMRVREVIGQLSNLLKDRMEEMQSSSPVVQFTIPLTIDGQTTELAKYESETAEAAVQRYLQSTQYTLDVQQSLYPQLLNLVNQKLAELQPPRKELFNFALTIDGKEAIARHFEQGDPVEEAKETLRSIGINVEENDAFVTRIVPQIANEILRRMNEQAPPQQPAQPEQPAAPQQQQQAKELFSLPLTMNDRPAILVHYEGLTARESGLRFLNENGVSDAATINDILPQLVQLIDSRLAELVQQEAMAKQQQEQEEGQRRLLEQQQAEAQAQAARTPLVTLPINVGENQVANLDYFEGDSVERTVELFLQNLGMEAGQAFNDNVAQLSRMIRERGQAVLAESQAQAQEAPLPTPLFSIPVTLSGTVYNLEYFDGQAPRYAANKFCVEKHEILRAELGVEYDGNQLQECQNVLTTTIENILKQSQASGEPTAQEFSKPAPAQDRVLLFTLDIDVDGESAQLPVYRNENPEAAARAFCEKYNVDFGSVPALVEAIQNQLAAINA